jgi:hypothetical protein
MKQRKITVLALTGFGKINQMETVLRTHNSRGIGLNKYLAFVSAFFCREAAMPAQNQNNKILAAYFSWSGNAGALAGQIARETGGDLFEIKTVKVR